MCHKILEGLRGLRVLEPPVVLALRNSGLGFVCVIPQSILFLLPHLFLRDAVSGEWMAVIPAFLSQHEEFPRCNIVRISLDSWDYISRPRIVRGLFPWPLGARPVTTWPSRGMGFHKLSIRVFA